MFITCPHDLPSRELSTVKAGQTHCWFLYPGPVQEVGKGLRGRLSLSLLVPSRLYCCHGVTPCLCGTRRLKGTLSVHQMIREWIWNNGGMILTGETDGLRDKRVPLHTRSPHIPHGLTLAWTPSSAVKSRQLASFFRVPLLLTENNRK
jgi:hypothetical protein